MAFFQPGKYLSHTLHLSRKTRNQATSKQDKTSSAKTKWLLARSLFRCTPTGISYTAFNIYKLITKFQLFFFFSPQKGTVSQNSQLTLNTPSAPSSRGTRTPLWGGTALQSSYPPQTFLVTHTVFPATHKVCLLTVRSRWLLSFSLFWLVLFPQGPSQHGWLWSLQFILASQSVDSSKSNFAPQRVFLMAQEILFSSFEEGLQSLANFTFAILHRNWEQKGVHLSQINSGRLFSSSQNSIDTR